jgi:hypothetical protein
LRKLLVSLLCAAVAVPAVALAAEAGNSSAAVTTRASDHAQVLRDKALKQERSSKRRAAKRRAHERKKAAAAGSTASPALQAIASCESGGDPHAIGGGGAYRGKYQFDQGTWASVGGSGDPAAAPEAEQDRRAAILYARSGASSWPVCGQ